jgi:Homeodomain-like domain
VPKKYRVMLTEADRQQLQELISRGRAAARTLTRARILLKADEAEGGPAWTNAAIQAALDVSEPLICRARGRYVTGGLPAALHRKEQARRKARKLDGVQEAHLIALVCGEPPDGRDRWSLRLIAERFVELGHVADLSHETVRRVLKRGN